MIRRRWLAWGLTLAVLLPLLAACMGNDDDDGDAPTATAAVAASTNTEEATQPTEQEEQTATATESAAEPSPEATATVEPTVFPTSEPEPTAGQEIEGDRPVDQQLNWFLAGLNGGEPPTPEEIEERLHPSFTEQVSAVEIAALFAELRVASPWEFAGYYGDPVELDAFGVFSSGQGDLSIQVGLEVEAPHRFVTLLLSPVTQPTLGFASFDEVDAWLTESSPPHVSFEVAEVTGGVCSQHYGFNADESLAVASAFKLWVLLDLAERVAAGEFSWDDPLVLSPESMSLPSGTLQVEPAGLPVSLQTHAAKMMVLSDNTATDHLINLLGRDSVVARMAATGEAMPERNVPLLLTRELFYLKLAASDDELATYVAADSEGRAALLASMEVDFSQADFNRLGMPTAIDSVEWFASASDFCGVYAALYQLASSDPVLNEILGGSSGIAFDAETWTFASYKGGNEAGVVAGIWLLERADGRVFTISAIGNDPGNVISSAPIPELINGVAMLLAEIE